MGILAAIVIYAIIGSAVFLVNAVWLHCQASSMHPQEYQLVLYLCVAGAAVWFLEIPILAAMAIGKAISKWT